MKDGGLAFGGTRMELIPYPNGVPGHVEVTYPGMTLRDYFAAHIIVGIIGGSGRHIDELRHPDSEAETAYLWADAMLKAREEKQA